MRTIVTFCATVLSILVCCVLPRQGQHRVSVDEPDAVFVDQIENTRDESTKLPEPVLVLAPRKVLVVGDSEACAVNLYIRKTVKEFNEALKQPLDVVDVDCKGGTTVQYWGEQGHFRESLSKHGKPDVVVVFLGTNHYWQTTTPPVNMIIDQLEPRTECLWVGNTAVKGRKWKINRLLKDAVTPRCQYFDTEAADIHLPDGVHPSGAAAIKWIKMIWSMIPLKYEVRDE